MDGELNEEEEDTLLLKAYTGHFDNPQSSIDEPVININFSEDNDIQINQVFEDKPIKINKKLQYIPKAVKDYFIKIENIKEVLNVHSGSNNNDSKDIESGFRYFSLTCHKCGLPGHFSVECPSKNIAVCYLCGEQHLSRECPNQICFKCFTPGHLRKDCKFPQAPKIACLRCFKTGHIPTECPKYFINFGDKEIYCYNCGYEGHAGPTCTEISADVLFDTLKKNTTPSYSSKSTILKSQNGSKKKRKSSSSNSKKKSAKRKKSH